MRVVNNLLKMNPNTEESVRNILYCVYFGECKLKSKSVVFIIHSVRELHLNMYIAHSKVYKGNLFKLSLIYIFHKEFVIESNLHEF